MSRILRLAIVGLVTSLSCLMFDIASVGARWVRMGNDEVVIDIITICDDGIKVTIANSANNYTPDFNPAPDEILYFYRGFLDPNVRFLNELPSNEVLASHYFELGYYPDAHLQGLPFTDSSQSFPTEAEWYATSNITWQQSPMNVGEEVSVVIKHILSEFESTIMVFGNLTVLNCSLPASTSISQEASYLPNFTDSRADTYHPWQSAAVYCEDDMVKVYGIDATDSGYFAFAVTQADIDKLGIPTENILLASSPSAFGGNIDLYKLKDTGELQINAPGLPPDSWKEYVFTWAGCS